MTTAANRAVEGRQSAEPYEDRLLTIKEVAGLIGISVGGCYHLVSQRRIPVVRVSRRCVRFRLSEIYRWWDELTEKPDPKRK